MPRFSVALVHHPVLHKDGSVISSAITNTDLHDIARSCTTFAVDRFYVVTPVGSQQDLARRLIHHWTRGAGAARNPDRAFAFGCAAVATSIDDALAQESVLAGCPAEAWVTSARPLPGAIGFDDGRKRMREHDVLMVLGTAHGLSPAAVDPYPVRLRPIGGALRGDGTRYNHLSVRAAAAIMLFLLRGEG